ncbi:glycosyltransferase family 4 protein [Blastococcus deserti]|uniref:Glycosyltransferase family 4 protein n=1 Tax=Blastococcus deserti TaxID=2259033 RepID=A0ABW4X5C1_9ACTN
MGEHMLALAAAYRPVADVSLLCRPTEGGRCLLDRAAGLGVRTTALPRPRDPAFGDTIVDFLARHPADVFHIHVGTGRENFDGARAARRARVPLVVQTLHQPWLLRHPAKRAALLRAITPVDRLIAVSDAQRRTYERAGVPTASLTTVPNGITARGRGPGRCAARAALGLDPDQLVVMTVGRLTEQKGQRYLVEATPELATRFPGLSVVVLGEGHLRDDLVRRAADLGVGDAVRLPGHRSDARLLIDAADVFVFPSRHEGMPLAVLEAMQAGLPVVATDVLGTAEVVADGETGTLTPPGDPRALAAAVAELLSDPQRRRRYGEAGCRRYLERFTAHRMATETLAVYDEALGGPRLPAAAART